MVPIVSQGRRDHLPYSSSRNLESSTLAHFGSSIGNTFRIASNTGHKTTNLNRGSECDDTDRDTGAHNRLNKEARKINMVGDLPHTYFQRFDQPVGADNRFTEIVQSRVTELLTTHNPTSNTDDKRNEKVEEF